MTDEDESKQKQIDKVAIILIFLETLTPGILPTILEHVPAKVIKPLLAQIAMTGKTDKSTMNELIKEFYELVIENASIFGGQGISDELVETLPQKTKDQLFAEGIELFGFLETMEDKQLLSFMKEEGNEIATLLLNYMSSDRMARLLKDMPNDNIKDISFMLLDQKEVNPEYLHKLHIHLEDYFFKESESGVADSTEKIAKMAQIFESFDTKIRDEILKTIKEKDEKLFESIENNMLAFEDLVHVPDNDFETIIYEVSQVKTLAIAMWHAPEEFNAKVIDVCSSRFKNILDEEKGLIKEVSEEESINAQTEVVQVARRLDREEKVASLLALKQAMKQG